jgi:hypothetical protein
VYQVYFRASEVGRAATEAVVTLTLY